MQEDFRKTHTQKTDAHRSDEGAKLSANKNRPTKAGSLSYGESPRTPPLERTSLHRRNNSVEKPWGILSLFTTCLRLRVWNHPATDCDTCRLRLEKHWRKNGAKRNVKQNKTIQKKSWVEKGTKQNCKREVLGTNKGTILSTKLNSTNMTRTWVEEGPRESRKEKQC